MEAAVVVAVMEVVEEEAVDMVAENALHEQHALHATKLPLHIHRE